MAYAIILSFKLVQILLLVFVTSTCSASIRETSASSDHSLRTHSSSSHSSNQLLNQSSFIVIQEVNEKDSSYFSSPGNYHSIANFAVTLESPFKHDISLKVNLVPPAKIPNTAVIDDRLQTNSLPRSEAKCREYSAEILNLGKAEPWLDTIEKLPSLSTALCRGPRTLVVGGVNAAVGEFPHVVALGRQKEDEGFSVHCAGSLIAPNWVLTAAHCTHGASNGVTTARLGVNRLSTNEGETIGIKRTVRHPSYKAPAMYADIALLELEKPVAFTDEIKPACLHQEFDYFPTFAWVCGWGATEEGGGESDILQKAKLMLVDNLVCAVKHNRSRAVPDGVVPSMVCARSPQDDWQIDTCYGDSGGPLQTIHPNRSCLYQIVGITSFGVGCGFVDIPGVYTRVSHYLDWIEDVVWPEYSFIYV